MTDPNEGAPPQGDERPPTNALGARWQGGEWSLHCLALLGILGFVYVGQAVLLPTVLAVLAYFVLSPVVNGLRRLHVPRWIGSIVVLGAFLAALAGSAVLLSGPATTWARDLPRDLAEVNELIGELKEPVEEVSRATDEITDVAGGEKVTEVTVEKPGLLGVFVTRMRKLTVTLFLSIVLLFLLLAQDEVVIERLGRRMGGGLSPEEGVRLANETRRDVSRYLLTITAINIGLGVSVGAVLALLDVPNPLLWGLVAALLNYVPYLGGAVGITLVFFVSLITFESLPQAIWPPLAYLVLNSIEGTLVTPMILGKKFHLNPFIVLLWIMLWTWLWGVPGGLVAVPLLVILRIVLSRSRPPAAVPQHGG